MMSTSPITRFVSIANATKMFRALPKRTFSSSSPARDAKFSGFFNHSNNMNASTPFSLRDGTIAARYNISRFGQQHQPQASRFFSSNTSRPSVNTSAASPFAKAGPATSSPFIQGQAIRGFSKRAWRDHEAAYQAAREHWHGAHAHAESSGRHIREHWVRCGGFRGFHHHHHHRMMRGRRPVRFLFRMMLLSTVLIAAPAVVVFDAPYSTLAYVPLTVFGAGAVLMLTGRILFIALPLVAVGGAAAFWMTVMPSASTAKDLKKLLKRDAKSGQYSTATSILGSDWEIQRAQPNEWFRWTFPERGDKKQLDKIDIRMTVFDPNDHSDLKEKSLEFMDKFKGFDGKERRCRKGRFGGDDCHIPESLVVKRDGDQFLIQMEDDGEKLMGQKTAKKYLALGRLVDRAAKEMEDAHPGLNLGEQVVLVHKNKGEDSFWSRWSPYGDLALRIPFNRTWVNDLRDL